MAELVGKIILVPIEDEVKTSYLNYAMSVITARALPDVRDGLKPVHRRLLYAMDELGLRFNAPTKKSARITGDAMGKYHPHGDFSSTMPWSAWPRTSPSAIPLSMAKATSARSMAIRPQPPVTQKPSSRGLARRCSQISTRRLWTSGRTTTSPSRNPLSCPRPSPNLIVNGSSGIAVGMATNMAPHNLVETSEAIAAFIEDPEISVEGLMRHIKGPDFPTGGIIFGRKGIRDAYTNGKGKVIVRGKFQIETMKAGREAIVFTEIPYAVNKTVLITRIAELIREKELDGVSDLRDESDREGMRIVLELKKGAIPKLVLNRLFTHTPLQSTFGINNMVIVDGRPMCLGLKDLISYFVKHRVEVVTRRSRYELRKAEEKAHVLRGLVIALQNIDEVVAIIKASKDTELAKQRLRERFGLDEIQAQAILDMRLARLTSLETEKLQAELAEIETRIAYLKELLASEPKILGVVKDETLDIARRYGDKRRTDVVADEIEHINIEDLIKKEEMVVLISNKGFMKRVPTSAYRNQSRGGKGSNSAYLMDEDYIEQLFVANTHDYLLFVSSEGKAYWLKAHEIPEATRQARGAHIKGLLAISPNEEITTVVDFKDFSDTEYILMGTLRGVVKKVATKEFVNAKTRGIIGIKLDEGDRLVSACLTNGKDEAVLVTRKGQALRITEQTVRVMGRASRGVTGIRLDKEDELTAMLRVSPDERILLLSEYGYGKRTDFDNFNAHGRGTGGQMIYCPEDKTGELVGAITVRDDDDVMVITSQGKTIKITAESVNIQGKAARGVRVVNIDRPDFVIGLDRVAREEEAEETDEAETQPSAIGSGSATDDAAKPAGEDIPPPQAAPSDEPRVDDEDEAIIVKREDAGDESEE